MTKIIKMPVTENTHRITMVMAGNEEGGLEKHVIELSNGLASRGYKVCVIAHEKYKDRLSQSINFTPVDLSKSRRNPIALWQLFTAIKASQPDILHVQANKAVAMVAPLLKWLKVPSVATLHGMKNALNAFKRFDRIIAVSEQVALQFGQQQIIRIIHNGAKIENSVALCTSELYTSELSNRPNDQSMIQAIAIGRLVPVKGFDVLISAWENIDAKLQIVGNGPEYAALQAQIQTLDLSDRIKLLGYRDDIAELIEQADVFIISSRQEGGPYTLVESLLMNTPVLATRVGMVPEILPSDLVCQPDSVSALHALLQNKLQDISTLNEISKPLYQFAHTHLSFDAMLDKTIEVYRELIPTPAPALKE